MGIAADDESAVETTAATDDPDALEAGTAVALLLEIVSVMGCSALTEIGDPGTLEVGTAVALELETVSGSACSALAETDEEALLAVTAAAGEFDAAAELETLAAVDEATSECEIDSPIGAKI